MGTLAGHILPGGFFMIFAIWWSFITSIRYIQSKLRSPLKKGQVVGYRSTVTMPCICLPSARLKRAPIESYFKAIFGTIGLLGELITGVSFNYHPSLNKDDTTLFGCEAGEAASNSHSHSHKRDMSHHIPELKVELVHFEYVNAQHITMYSAFILGSIIEILIYHRVDVPARLDYVFGTMAYAIEAFLFAFHLHSRAPLDIHVHVLLVYAIMGCVVCSLLEVYKPNQILFTYGRILFTMLQGTWFWEAGFILYPPFQNDFFVWNRCDHNQIMTVTMTFCWHIILISSGLLIQMWIMKRVYFSSKRIRDQWDDLIVIDEDIRLNNVNNTNSGVLIQDVEKYAETKFLSLNSEDEDSVEENVEYDSTRNLLNSNINKESSKAQFTNISLKNKKESSSASSTTSGNYSANA